jgi:hypothetical protein
VIIGLSALGCPLKAEVYNRTSQCVPSMGWKSCLALGHIEITYSVPFFKSYKPVTEGVSAKLQPAITFEKEYRTCNSCVYSKRLCHL